jgi:hypothetical protein
MLGVPLPVMIVIMSFSSTTRGQCAKARTVVQRTRPVVNATAPVVVFT